MADKKRKGAMSVPAPTPPAKRSKKSTASEPIVATKADMNEVAGTVPETNNVVTKSKTSRKRAVDFLGEAETTTATATTNPPPAAISQPAKKTKKSAASAISEDTVNGTQRDRKRNGSSIVTATPTVDPVSEDENSAENEDEDQGAVLLAGFDSDGEDPADDQGDLSKTQPIPHLKETSKKLKQAKEKGSDGPGTVYIGRIPHGFYEIQMREYFSQFGDISRLRLSRNKRTGASKHFAFIEFASDEVAKIVAETMDNYLMFGHILKCKYAPPENLHPDVWKGANKKYRRIPHDKIERQRLEAPKTQEQWTKKNEKERRRRVQQAEKMKAIGYEYEAPELKDPAEALDQRRIEQEHDIPAAKLTNDEEPNPIAPPPSAPSEEGTTKKKTKAKKQKDEGSLQLLTQGNLGARDAGPAAESAKITQNQADKNNNIATIDTVRAPAAKKPRKVRTETSIQEGSNHGEYDNLSSIPVGTEAAPLSVTDAIAPEALESINTYAGIADAVLAERKSDRKKARPSKRGKSSEEKAEEQVSSLAPGAVSRDKQEKEKREKKEKKERKEKDKLKGILKK